MQAVVQVHMFILALFDVDAMRIRKSDSASPRNVAEDGGMNDGMNIFFSWER